MFCSECGKQVADDAKYCGECGAVQVYVKQTTEITVEQELNTNKLKASAIYRSIFGNSNLAGYVVGAIMLVGISYYVVNYFAVDKFETTNFAQINQVESATSQTLEKKLQATQDQYRLSKCTQAYCSQIEFGSNVPMQYGNSITLEWCESNNSADIYTGNKVVKKLGDGVSVEEEVNSRKLDGTNISILSNQISFDTNSTNAHWIFDRSNGILKAYDKDNTAWVLDNYKCTKDNPNF